MAQFFHGLIKEAIRFRRKKERYWRIRRSVESRREYVQAKNRVNRLIRKRKFYYYQHKINEAGSNSKKLYQVLNNLTGRQTKSKLPDGYSDTVLANKFMTFFNDKITTIVDSFQPCDIPFYHVFYPTFHIEDCLILNRSIIMK